VDELVAGGWLPADVGRRPDGSGLIVESEGESPRITDSRRGKLGSFLPIADTTIEAVSDEEYRWYTRRAEFYSEDWQQMDPVLLGVRVLSEEADGTQRIGIHGEVAPLVPEKYGWITQQLGPPTVTSLQFAPDDVAAIQAHVASDLLGGAVPPYLLFFAVKDHVLPNTEELDGLLDKYRALRSLSAYLGAWPEPAVIDRLPLGLGEGAPVGPGMTRLLGGLYRYRGNAFSILSFIPEVITASLPHLKVVEREQPAQVRMHVDNLRGTQLEAWVNQQLYRRGFRASLAGARLLDSLTTQLGVPPERADEVAADLLDAQLQCALGGDYLLAKFPQGVRWWTTAVSPEASADDIPIGYLAPILDWFRGASGRLTQYEARVVADLLVDIAGE
jgi:hypothetical protein